MEQNAKIYVAGHSGLIGSALVQTLRKRGYFNIITRTREELDLCDECAVFDFFEEKRPEYVFLAAAKVGGIIDNITCPAWFFYNNIRISTNVIHNACVFGVRRLIFFGSSCMYPIASPQPMCEKLLFSGTLEPTSKAYAVAKLAGMTMCEAYNKQFGTSFIVVIPNTTYGPGDNFDLQGGHVLSSLIARFHNAVEMGENKVSVWGTGTPRREFVYVDDVAEACILIASHPSVPEVINIGVGSDISIAELEKIIAHVTRFRGMIERDLSKPDGAQRKLLDSSLLFSLGWRPQFSLEEGIELTYDWYRPLKGK